jgi:hypothetical protein
VYAIYWQPSNWSQSFASGYSTLLNRYFGDVAADSGQTSNVYDAATQYSGIQYSSSFAGSVTATDQIRWSGPAGRSPCSATMYPPPPKPTVTIASSSVPTKWAPTPSSSASPGGKPSSATSRR